MLFLAVLLFNSHPSWLPNRCDRGDPLELWQRFRFSGDSPGLQAGVGRNLGKQQDKPGQTMWEIYGKMAVFLCRRLQKCRPCNLFELDLSGTLWIDHQALKVDASTWFYWDVQRCFRTNRCARFRSLSWWMLRTQKSADSIHHRRWLSTFFAATKTLKIP